jgi:two-component system, NtrC family, sensor kinase
LQALSSAVVTRAAPQGEPDAGREAWEAREDEGRTRASVAQKSLRREAAKRRELEKRLAQSLEREKAAGETLRVISRSPTDVQPAFDAILRSAVQLSGALMGGIYRFDGELIHLTGVYGIGSEAMALHARGFPRPPDRGFLAARAILERRAMQMPDALEDPEFQGKEFARAAGWRSSLSVPMLRDGQPIGAISVARAGPGPVPETIVALLRTFADQAVIAIARSACSGS